MSNFMQAVKWMKEGKKVRRYNSDAIHFLSSDVIYWKHKQMEQTYKAIKTSDVEATDWEIYEENKLSKEDESSIIQVLMNKIKKATNSEIKEAKEFLDKLTGKEEDNWNLAKFTLAKLGDVGIVPVTYEGNLPAYFKKEDIKTFIQKVKKDMINDDENNNKDYYKLE